MTVTINGSSGITAPEVILDNTTADGGQVVLKSSGYSNWNLDNYSGRLRAYYGSTEYFTINSSGNVGIGTSSPSGKLNVSGSGYQYVYVDGGASTGGSALVLRQGTTNSIAIGNYAAMNGFGSSNDGVVQASNGNMQLQVVGANYMRFDTNNTERARIDSSGNLLVGTTSAAVSARLTSSFLSSSSIYGSVFIDSQSNNTAIFAQFRNGSGALGSITNNNNSAVAYNTSSDYRLKENIAPMTGALDKVAQLKPCTYTWKATNENSQGFIAHELQEVVPDCVTGEKDAVDAEGNPVYQGIDTSFLVATLTAAIQEQQTQIQDQLAIITSLTARIEALENK